MAEKINFKAVIFDLDGVITKTASVHSKAWKKMFDEYLKLREKRDNEIFKEFTHEADYLPYVDGKPRYKGVQSFLKSRGIEIEFGTPDDKPNLETACGLGNRKNELFNEIINQGGAEVFETSVKFIKDLIANGIRIGVASSSKNCKPILEAAGLLKYFETRVDGVVSAELGLNGKPEADIFTTAADNLGVSYNKSVIVEDAVSGVQAGRNGNFGLVLGVAREDNVKELRKHGADIVVNDLSEISIKKINSWFIKGIHKDNWQINYYDYTKEKEGHRESILSVGNGFFCTRGSIEETCENGINYPATYITGVYNRLFSKVGDKTVSNEDLVNCPNWYFINFKINGQEFDINNCELLDFKRTLNLKKGINTKFILLKDLKDRITKIKSERFISMADPHLAAIRYTILPLNYSAEITIITTLDSSVENKNVKRYLSLATKHLNVNKMGEQGKTAFLESQTNESAIKIAVASKVDSKDVKNIVNKDVVISSVSKNLREDEEFSIIKYVSIYTSMESKNPLKKAQEKISQELNYNQLFLEHKNSWSKIWDDIDIFIKGDRLSQKIVRLNAYHLVISNSPISTKWDSGIYARGLTGECYRGHIFWDDVFIFPFYCMNFPLVAKNVLMYRVKRLDAAKRNAQEFNYDGVMFPWQSGRTGTEETQLVHLNPLNNKWEPDYSSLQRHVSLAIAYNVSSYFHYTKDKEFMEDYGILLMGEITKFWASATELNEGKYSINKVMGPDEFHEKLGNSHGLTNNSYTNIMVVWLMERCLELLNNSPNKKVLMKKLNILQEDLKKWKDISENLKIPMLNEGVIEQFEGYRTLKELDWDFYKEKYGNIQRMDRILKSEGKSPDDYKVSKQPDTLMAPFILGEEKVYQILTKLGYKPKKDFLKINYDYYKQRTSHGSTLSRIVFSKLAHQLGEENLSKTLFMDALTSDFTDIQGGTTKEGIHTGAMGGSILLILFSYVGLNLNGKNVVLSPKLPKNWEKLSFGFSFRNVKYRIKIWENWLEILAKSKEKENIQIVVNDKLINLKSKVKKIIKGV